MSKAVISTPPQRVVVADENEELLERVVLNEMTLNENTIMGNVSDKITGKPIDGVCIKICDDEYRPIAYNFTDVDGNFTLQAQFTPNVRIIAAKKGYITFSSESMPSAALEKKALNLELVSDPNSGIVFFGSVRDFQQKALGNIKVTLFKANSLNPYDFTFTNSDGVYVFDNIEPGPYRIAFQSQFYNERSLTLDANRDQQIITLEVVYLKKRMLKGTIYGIITDKNGRPVNNALVVLCNANQIPIQATHTNEMGIYLFYRLEPGTYTILAK